MDEPDKRALEADLEDAPFRIGVANGQWGLADPKLLPEGLTWPDVVFWVIAAPRDNASERYYVRLDCSGYPNQAATGTFWDPETKESLAFAKRPKGTGRVGLVFRIDWQGGRAFYHPYDRLAASHHPNWAQEHPHCVWTSDRSIVDLLSVIHELLNCNEYTGI
jgi:hypothetical protein